MIKQIFVRKFCKSGYSANLAFECIHQLKLYTRSEEVEVDEIVDLEFLKKNQPRLHDNRLSFGFFCLIPL